MLWKQGTVVEINEYILTVVTESSRHGMFHVRDQRGVDLVLYRTVYAFSDSPTAHEHSWRMNHCIAISTDPNIVPCIACSCTIPFDDPGLVQALYLCDISGQGTLSELLGSGVELRTSEVLYIFAGICDAIYHLHSLANPVACFNIAPEQISFHKGIARVTPLVASYCPPIIPSEASRSYFETRVPCEYRSPEMLAISTTPITIASDIWGLGCVLYTLMYGVPPFYNANSIVTGSFVMPSYPDRPKSLVKLVSKLLLVDSSSRPNIIQLRKMLTKIIESMPSLSRSRQVSETIYGSGCASLALQRMYNDDDDDEPLSRVLHEFTSQTPTFLDEENVRHKPISHARNAKLVTTWVEKALNLHLSAPKPKYVRKLIILTWESFSCLFILNQLLDSPHIKNNAVIVFKFAQTIHKMLFDGPSSLLRDAYEVRSRVRAVSDVWDHRHKAMVERDHPLDEKMDLVALDSMYLKVVLNKILFHKQCVHIEGNFAMGMYLAAMQSAGYHGIDDLADYFRVLASDTIIPLLHLGQQLINISSLCSDIVRKYVGCPEPVKLVIVFMSTVLLPVLDDLTGIFQVTTFLMDLLNSFVAFIIGDYVNTVSSKYSHFFSNLTLVVSKISTIPVINEFNRIPALPTEEPTFQTSLQYLPMASNFPKLGLQNQSLCCSLKEHLLQLARSHPMANDPRTDFLRYRSPSPEPIDATWIDNVPLPTPQGHFDDLVDDDDPLEDVYSPVEEDIHAAFKLDMEEQENSNDIYDVFCEVSPPVLETVLPPANPGDPAVDQIIETELVLGDRIGVGAFAEVYRADFRGTSVAVKKLLNNDKNTDSLREFSSELEMNRKLRHPNIVMYMGCVIKPPHFWLVTELLQMSLFDLLHNTTVKLNWKIRFKILIDICQGMNYLHLSQPAIIHRDLKSANILVDKHFGVKISDFGLSRVKALNCTMTGQTGTFQWMSPEVISSEAYTEKVY